MALDNATQVMAPSMVEYHLDDLSNLSDGSAYLNRSNIQQTIYINDYSLYLDYNDEIYLEFEQKDNEYETQSFMF